MLGHRAIEENRAGWFGVVMQSFSRKSRKLPKILVLLLVAAAAGAAWFALRVGPEPLVSLDTDWPAIGAATVATASFAEPAHGLGVIRLEVEQGGRIEVLSEDSFAPGSPLPSILGGGGGVANADLEAVIGTDSMPWLEEGEVVLRATATRSAGFLRRPQPTVVELTTVVRRRPPRLEIVSTQHYARQGGSGAVVYRVGDNVLRSGVRAGEFEATGFPLEGGGAGDRFVLYAIPWNVDDAGEVRLFAEDDAGNRTEQPFLDLFKPMAPRSDTIQVSDDFLARVVPAIASQTPSFDATGSLLDQYLVINGELRAAELARVAELSRTSPPAFLWSGPFLQMPNTALKANFAQTRTYLYNGEAVDRQTHLGLDLASTARAPVPAPNSGVVVFAGWMTLYGNAVIIDHGYGLLSLCGHMASIDVATGDPVTRGQIIGLSGATGLAGGDHLHLEIFVQGQSVDPLEWLDAKWIRDNLASKLPVPVE
jgi:murein DD-endopeptidase MepM/ murein hydrolase activator NlpD